MALSIFAGVIIFQILFFAIVVREQTDRVTASTLVGIQAIELSLSELSGSAQDAFLDKIRSFRTPPIGARSEAPLGGIAPTSFIGKSLAEQLPPGSVQVDGDALIWVRLGDPEGDIWIPLQQEATPPRGSGLPLVAAVTLGLATLGGAVLQSRVARPLSRLAKDVSTLSAATLDREIDANGPREVTSVARAFNELLQRLKSAEDERNVMLAGVSHDLRTPLTKLRLSLEMLPSPETDLLEGAKRQVTRIDDMMSQFLEYARGHAYEEVTATRLADVFLMVQVLVGSDVDLETDFDPNLVLKAKPQALARAIANLINNAYRYGTPPVLVRIRKEGPSVHIDIIDHGPGISGEDRARLLQPFSRGNTARTEEGTGLGLAIVDQVARAHNGSVEFLTEGRKFTVRLALQCP